MFELGRPGTSGCAQGDAPVLRDGAVVAVLSASSWREAATARVEGRDWVFGRRRGEFRARWAADPADAVRLRAAQASFWKSTWALDLEGRQVDVELVSRWKAPHRFLADGRQVAVSGSTGGWSPRPTLQVDEPLPIDHVVFLLWFELALHRRNQAAMGAATGAAVIGGSS